MDRISIIRADENKAIEDFINLPKKIYSGNRAWVPPLKGDFKKYILGESNSMTAAGPCIRLMAYKNDQPAARLIAGINQHLNEAKGFKEGYISLFESIEDINVSQRVLEEAQAWFIKNGMHSIKGPLSLPGGDDNRGFIIDNFTDPTLIMGSYNKPYYNDFFMAFGFEKYLDCYAYKINFDEEMNERYERLVPYAMKKYKFDVCKLDIKNIQSEMSDIKQIIYEAMPVDWDDFIPPDDHEIDMIAKQIIPVADPDLIYIARNHEGRPIGFNLTLPDYNQVLKKMNGKLFPLGVFKYMYYKNKIDRARFFVLFVIPEYRKKGVPTAIYLESFKAVKRKGYSYGEGSTIWEYNEPMIRDIETFGGTRYKTYRIYKKNISSL
jgi:GNAT superfamily N-acetyltransferase